MSRILSFLMCATLSTGMLVGCKDKTPAQKKLEKIEALREVKRQKAVEYYKQFAKDFPDDPRAAEATLHASQLAAAAPKK